MPNFLCKYCQSMNRVSPDMTHFTCRVCGKKQEMPSLQDSVENTSLNEVVLEQSSAEDSQKQGIFSQFVALENIDEATGEQEDEETARKNTIYYAALSKMGGDNVALYEQAIEEFESIPGWKDADDLIPACKEQIKTLLSEQHEADTVKKQKEKKHKRKLRIGLPLLGVTLLAAILFTTVINPSLRYQRALSLAASGDTVEAYETFSALSDYKDSSEQANELYDTYKVEKLKSAAVGDTLYWGAYEQDNNTDNGKEDIAWKVLDKADGKILMCTEYGIDYIKYNEEKVDTTWESSHLRAWLNSEFLQEAFTEEQRSVILTTDIPAEKNPNYDTSPGSPTKDKVFLLSIAQAERYFRNDSARMALPTAYAVENGAYASRNMHSIGNTCCWFLRNPGDDGTQVAYVYFDGAIHHYGASVNTRGATFRPVMWVAP